MFKFLLVASFAALGAANIIPSFNFDNKIVGGKKVSIEEYPYQVSLQYFNKHYCGASILNKNFIISAGHCATLMQTSGSAVKAGINSTGQVGSYHEMLWVKRHEDYHLVGGAPINDIAIAKVDPPFHFDATRSPVALYDSKEDIEEGQMSVITGYGTTSEGGQSSESLMAVEVPIVSRKRCSEIYKQFGLNTIGEDCICAGFDKGGKDSCQGDSGGPIVVNGQLAGIVSYGVGCARPGVPGVYTNIFHYAQWIADSMT